MKLIAKDRLEAYNRVLLWLHERSDGSANLGEVSSFVWGRPNHKPVVAIARALTTRGWAECAERTPTGTYIWIFDRRISLLPAGRIWADFLLEGTPEQEWSVADMLTRIRALERALAPFAELGVGIRKSRGPEQQSVPASFTRGELEMAADVLRPYAEGATIYPWSPTSARGRPWLRSKSEEKNSPTEQPARSE